MSMMENLSSNFLDLVYDALLKSFWTKKALKRFLKRCHIADTFLAQLGSEESKREWLDKLFPKLEATERGRSVIQAIATSLAEQTSFPDLDGWEDSAAKIATAKTAVERLKGHLAREQSKQKEEVESKRLREEAQGRREKIQREKTDLLKLRERLEAMCSEIGTQGGGYAFQEWFYDLASFSEVEHRRPYVTEGRQVDGSLTIDGTTYLVELKFTGGQASATDVDSLLAKVNTKSDNTMGLMICMSGYSEPASKQASFAKSPLLLTDHSHLYAVLLGTMDLSSLVRRIRRHSSQTGQAYLHPSKFGSG